ncbi:MAG: lytic transglycosylase domain-containing protein [Alphaproteobacteria bacterium]
MNSRRIRIGAAVLLLAALPAGAQSPPGPAIPGVRMMAPIPDTPPGAQGRHIGPRFLSPSDREAFLQALDGARRFDWARARTAAAQVKDKVARDLLTWMYLLDDTSGAPFSEIDAFQRDHPDWPRQDALFARAEKALPESASPQSVLTWFGSREPVSGWGLLKLGEALLKTGERSRGVALIRKGWIQFGFPPDEEVQILTRYGEHLGPLTHKERIERQLWEDDCGGAERQMARVDAHSRRLAETRIKLARGLGSPSSIYSNQPGRDRDDAGILFDLARAYRRTGEEEKATQTLLRISHGDEAKKYAAAIWPERHIDARDSLKAGRHRPAYNLVSNSHLKAGTEYADAEFLAGWIALRFLESPKIAREHFEKLLAAVSTPISRARAYYWLGRADEAAGRAAEAAEHYQRASQYGTTFYGQLALARIEERPNLNLREYTPEPSGQRATFLADSRVQAMRVLAEFGEDDLVRQFSARLMPDADATRLLLLANLLVELNNRALAVRAAKQASYTDTYLMEHLYPSIDIPTVPRLAVHPEPALVHAIARQESEFDPLAVSRAGALGIMQLMPGSARATARAYGLPYDLAGLTRDIRYNMQLGQAHFADFHSQWGGSYVLAIASYNAGENNVRKWIASYGDPRSQKVDPIDWIELIPFGETRNYVQRVLENTGVYRNRLAGRDTPLRILADLYRPREPSAHVIRAASRPQPAQAERPAPIPNPARGEPTAAAESESPLPAPIPKPSGTASD